MRCSKAVHHIHLYIDHRLTLRQTRVLEAHISSCLACRANLTLLEATSRSLDALRVIPEPTNMHEQIMQRVASSASSKQSLLSENQATSFKLFRPSLSEILAAVLLATIATLLPLFKLPFIKNHLAVTGNDPVSHIYTIALNRLTSIDPNTLSLILWIVGTLLGVLITLMVAGNDLRTQWFKAMITRLPVR